VKREQQKMQIFNEERVRRLKTTGRLYLTEKEKRQIWKRTWERMIKEKGWKFWPGQASFFFLNPYFPENHKG